MKKIKNWKETIASEALWVKAHRGAASRLAEMMKKRTGVDKNWRQFIELYLTPTERQVEPLYSSGIILLEQIQKLKEMVAKEETEEIAK